MLSRCWLRLCPLYNSCYTSAIPSSYWLDMSINKKRSSCLRVGLRYSSLCSNLITFGGREIMCITGAVFISWRLMQRTIKTLRDWSNFVQIYDTILYDTVGYTYVRWKADEMASLIYSAWHRKEKIRKNEKKNRVGLAQKKRSGQQPFALLPFISLGISSMCSS